MTNSRPATASEREIVITRTIDAPRELVFAAFTEVSHLSRWWGPDGFTTTTRAFAFREGGAWDFVITLRTVFPTAALRDRAVDEYHAVEGGRQTLDHLAVYVTERERPNA
jgi:hypothetical protein